MLARCQAALACYESPTAKTEAAPALRDPPGGYLEYEISLKVWCMSAT
jgi:hypothetical protein